MTDQSTPERNCVFEFLAICIFEFLAFVMAGILTDVGVSLNNTPLIVTGGVSVVAALVIGVVWMVATW